MATPPFSAISLLQAAHARNTPPPWWHLEEGAEGQRGQGGRAAGAGWWVWRLAGGRAAGGWGWLVGLAAWWHGGMGAWKGMIGFDIYIYIYICKKAISYKIWLAF